MSLLEGQSVEGSGQESNQESQSPEATPSFLYDVGIAGQGDVSDWFKADKYDTVVAQAKAYPSLEKRFGGFTGAPKDGYELPEELDSEDTFVQALNDIGSGANMNQETYNQLLELGDKMLSANTELNREQEFNALGDNAEQRIQNVDAFMRNNLGEKYEELSGAVTSAKTVELVEALIASTAQPSLPSSAPAPVNVPTQADIDEMIAKTDDRGQMLYHTSEAYRNRVREAMARMHGKSSFSYLG